MKWCKKKKKKKAKGEKRFFFGFFLLIKNGTKEKVTSHLFPPLLRVLFRTPGVCCCCCVVDDVFFLSRACFVSFSSTFFASSVRRGVLSRARASLSVVRTVPLNGQKERETKRWSIGIIIITVRRRGARRSVRSTGTPRGKIRTQAKMLWQRREGTFFVLALKYYFTRDDVMMI